MKISTKKLRHLIAEERATAKSYRRYGFGSVANQEAKHSKFFTNVLKRRKK